MSTPPFLSGGDATPLSAQPSTTDELPEADAPTASWLSGGAAILDDAGRILECNSALAVWLQTEEANLISNGLPDVLGGRHAEWRTGAEELLSRRGTFERTELHAGGPAGEERIAVDLCNHADARSVRINSVLPPAQELESVFPHERWGGAVSHSVVQRLVRAEAQLDNLTRRWPGVVFSQRPDFTLSYASPRLEEISGISLDEWRRHSGAFWQVIHEDDLPALRARLRQPELSPEGSAATFRIRHARTGRIAHVWEHRCATYSSNGLLLGWEGIWMDITRQAVAERRLLNMSWKENLGTLTMGLAHDFCNVMAGIVGLSEAFEEEIGDNDALRGPLGMIRTSALQAGALSRQLRQLHQGQPGEKSYQDLNEVAQEMSAILERVLSRRVALEVNRWHGQLPVYLDAVELRQVIVNLALNAVEAMPDGGRLTFTMAAADALPEGIEVHGAKPRPPLVRLSIRDTGHGIPACHLGSIFEPFFTTKPMTKGSGLGLHNAKVFAAKHGAAITVESREEEGATFHLWFSQADFSESEQADAVPDRSRQTVLVVGTEGEVDRTAELLRGHGIYAVVAHSEAEMLPILHSPEYHFNGMLLLCDGASPLARITGAARGQRPPLRLLLQPVNCEERALDALQATTPGAAVLPELADPDYLPRLQRALNSEAA